MPPINSAAEFATRRIIDVFAPILMEAEVCDAVETVLAILLEEFTIFQIRCASRLVTPETGQN